MISSCIAADIDLTILETKGIISPLKYPLLRLIQEACVKLYIDIALIITSIALIASVILQSKGAGLGGLTGGDTGGVFTARRGVEKVLFRVTIVLSVLFFALTILASLTA
jgi:preprotein translocase subunit SecG